MKTLRDDKQSGSTIILVMTIMTIIMAAVAVAIDYSMNINRHVQRTNTLASAMAIGDGCMDHMFGHWRKLCRAQQNAALTTNDLSNLTLPTVVEFSPTGSPSPAPFSSPFAKRSNFDPSKNWTIQQYKVVAVDPELNPMPSNTATPIPAIGRDPSNKTFNYLATAYVTLPSMRVSTANTGALVAKVQRVFQKEQISPWNYAIFYNDPLEIHPGPEFHVAGWVHTNSDLYTGHNTLWLDDKATFGNNWKIGFMPGDGKHSSETPTSPHWPTNLPPALDNQHEPFGLDFGTDFHPPDPNDGSNPNQNDDEYHELIEPALSGAANTPDPFSPSGEPRERYYDQASVIIEISDSPAAITVTLKTSDHNGTVSNLATSDPLYTMFNGAMSTNYQLKDNREAAAQVRIATLDISKLIDSSTGNWKAGTFNRIIYISDVSASANGTGAKRGIRLKGGSVIPQNGLTVASWNAVYIQGDFNTGGTGSTVPSNSGNAVDAVTPQVSGYTRQPCSVVADAVYILSNNWTDTTDSFGIDTRDLTARKATNTTVNTAIVAGIVPTNSNNNGKYSGGAENFPRFNEDWGGHTLTYYGSMIELFNSQQAIGNWGNDNVYNPPLRQWFFDTNFKTTAPPGSLMIYNYIKGRWSLAP